MKSAELNLGIEGGQPVHRQGFRRRFAMARQGGAAREGRSSAFIRLRRDKTTNGRWQLANGVGVWSGPSNAWISRISQISQVDFQCENPEGRYYESYDNGLTRSRSFGPRGPRAWLRFLSPVGSFAPAQSALRLSLFANPFRQFPSGSSPEFTVEIL